MPKLKRLSGAEVRAILEAHGFIYLKTEGSHMKLRRTDEDGRIWTATVPTHRELATGTLSSIIHQSGLGRGPFEA